MKNTHCIIALKPTPQLLPCKQRIRVCLPLPHTALQLVHSCHSPTWQSVSLGPPQGLVSLLASVNPPFGRAFGETFKSWGMKTSLTKGDESDL